MLSSKATATVLLLKPSIKGLINSYNRKLKYLMSFNYNTTGISAEIIFDTIGDVMEKLEHLKMLSNVIDTAYSLLNDKQKRVIKGVFFCGLTFDQVMKKEDLTEYEVRSGYNNGVKKMGINISVLGFNSKRILEYFDTEPLFIESAIKANERFFQK